MSLSHGKLCLRYSSVLFEERGTTSFQTTTLNRTPEYIRHNFCPYGPESFHVKPITPGHPIPKISTRLTIFWGDTWKTEFVKTIHRQERISSEKKSDELHKKCLKELWIILLFELLLIQQRSAWNEHSINYWKSIVKHYWF